MKTLASCCGHGKYPMTIIVKGNPNFELMHDIEIKRKSRFYKKDKQGYFYVPEVMNEQRRTQIQD